MIDGVDEATGLGGGGGGPTGEASSSPDPLHAARRKTAAQSGTRRRRNIDGNLRTGTEDAERTTAIRTVGHGRSGAP